MIAQFKQDLYNKSFSHQDQGERDDGLRRRPNFWPYYVVKMGGAIPDNVYNYDYSDPALGYFFRGPKYDPELREFKKNS